MELQWMAVGALALIPCAAMAQSKTARDSSARNTSAVHQTAASQTVQTTSTGDVSSPGSDVTPAMLAEQNDPKLIGSPAWWKNHATADGKPLSAQRTSYH
ncbi:MAG: hypothetical protein JJD97_01080 [Gemmatimonadaceae bacterium]|nr:hypothetical protein [Gemmatimonadaceae bacterium]